MEKSYLHAPRKILITLCSLWQMFCLMTPFWYSLLFNLATAEEVATTHKPSRRRECTGGARCKGTKVDQKFKDFLEVKKKKSCINVCFPLSSVSLLRSDHFVLSEPPSDLSPCPTQCSLLAGEPGEDTI